VERFTLSGRKNAPEQITHFYRQQTPAEIVQVFEYVRPPRIFCKNLLFIINIFFIASHPAAEDVGGGLFIK
jgi:hypothetical protein